MYRRLFFITAIWLFSYFFLLAQPKAFPSAEGFGQYAIGGRGGDVYHVTKLNDVGLGSLRYGLKSAKGPRTIVFEVSGVIQLKSPLKVEKDYITIAGQTAPGDGICLRDAYLGINANHVIIRYIRSRLGATSGTKDDAISIKGGHNIILDHCSASWSVDEGISCSSGIKGKLDSVTVQWCIISEALNKSIHAKGSHGYGALIRGCYGAKYTYHHNLFAHNKSRNPRPGNYDSNNHRKDPEGLLFDFRNNVIYNWGGSQPGYDGDKNSVCRFNFVANYGKPGPDSKSKGYAYKAGSKFFKAHFDGYYYFGDIPADQWQLVRFDGWTETEIQAYKKNEPFSTGPIVTESPGQAYERVLRSAGASLVRDKVDIRVTNDVRNGTGSIINDEGEVGAWPVYHSKVAPVDADRDGMPDEWEVLNGLIPTYTDDGNDDRDSDGFTNLEEYLNSLVEETMLPLN